MLSTLRFTFSTKGKRQFVFINKKYMKLHARFIYKNVFGQFLPAHLLYLRNFPLESPVLMLP